MAGFQAEHQRQLVSLSLNSKKEQFRAADWDVQALKTNIRKSMTDLNYTQTLIRNGPNSNESAFVNSTQQSLDLRIAAQASLVAAEGVSSVPDVYAGGAGALGSPLEFNKITGGSTLSTILNFASNIMSSQAESSNTTANMQLTKSTWDRRTEEWMHDVDDLTIDLQALECQKLAADRRREMALQDLNMTKRQIEHAAEVQDFIRDKTTKFDLYLFLQRETAIIYRQSYDMALQAAKEAQEMFYYERRDTTRDFLQDCAWDNLHEGFMAGDKLSLALRMMDRAYTETNVREYELTKQLSLSMHFPRAFLQLKATGSCEFSVPEWMFDLDYPGQYMRRIRTVSLSIPCVVGPHTGIHCHLELLGSTIRVSPMLPDQSPRYECQSFTSDDRFAHLYGPREAIATSMGMGDAGVFELNFRDERYLPFEFAGAVSKWRIELPPENNGFDLETLTDVVVQLNYTAREGGEGLRHAEARAARARLPGDGYRLFDVRQEFPDAWVMLNRDIRADGAERLRKRHGHGDYEHGKHAAPILPLPFHRNMFPFLTGRRAASVVRLQLFIQAEEPMPVGAHIRVLYHPAGYQYDDGDEYYSSNLREFDCVVQAEMPILYHGVIDVEIEVPPARRSENKGCGVLRFPDQMSRIREAYVLCQYKVRDTPVSNMSMHRLVEYRAT
jgi:hypothetical protein